MLMILDRRLSKKVADYGCLTPVHEEVKGTDSATHYCCEDQNRLDMASEFYRGVRLTTEMVQKPVADFRQSSTNGRPHDLGTMSDCDKDSVWEHGENRVPGWICKYCKLERKGCGATRLKEHLAGRGSNVVHCMFVPKEVCEYYRCEIDRTKEKTKQRKRDKIRAEDIAREGNVSTDEEDDELQAAMHASRQQHEYETRSRAHDVVATQGINVMSIDEYNAMNNPQSDVIWS